MVVTFLPATSETAVWQERTACPSRCTVQAPHNPAPQPYFVPVSCRCSRTTHSSGVCGATSTSTTLSLSVNPIGAMRDLPNSLRAQFLQGRLYPNQPAQSSSGEARPPAPQPPYALPDELGATPGQCAMRPAPSVAPLAPRPRPAAFRLSRSVA